MNKKLLLIIIVFVFLSTGCTKNNIFSWAHKPGNGSYADLMSDGNAAMQNRDYAKAKEIYRAAIKAKSDDKDAIMEYASAVVADIFGRNFSEIINDLIAHGERGMLTWMTPDRIANADLALNELVNDPGLLPAVFSRAITDDDTNLNIAAIYALAGVVNVLNNNAVRACGAIDGAFRLDPTKLPKGNANVNAALREMRRDLETAVRLLGNITDKGPIVDNLFPRLNIMLVLVRGFLGE